MWSGFILLQQFSDLMSRMCKCMQDSYNVNHEVERKKALNTIFSQSRQQDREDAKVFFLTWVPTRGVELDLSVTRILCFPS